MVLLRKWNNATNPYLNFPHIYSLLTTRVLYVNTWVNEKADFVEKLMPDFTELGAITRMLGYNPNDSIVLFGRSLINGSVHGSALFIRT